MPRSPTPTTRALSQLQKTSLFVGTAKVDWRPAQHFTPKPFCHATCTFATSKNVIFKAIPIGTARGQIETRNTQRPANKTPPANRTPPPDPLPRNQEPLPMHSGKKASQGLHGLWHKLSFSSLLPAKVARTILLTRPSSS